MRRMIALIKKELFTIIKDKSLRGILLGPPILQLLIFTAASVFDVINIDVSILDFDKSKSSNELVRSLEASERFRDVRVVDSPEELKSNITLQKSKLGIYIPNNFEENIMKNTPVTVGVALDGRLVTSSRTAFGYFQALLAKVEAELRGFPQAIDNVIDRAFYNPSLLSLWWIVPNLLCSITMVTVLNLTSGSISREKEEGTFEYMLISPLNSMQILIGKSIPALILSLMQTGLMFLVGVYYFEVPFHGNFFTLLLVLVLFVISMIGVGLFISSLANNQQQSLLGTFIFMIPTFLISGYSTPIANMPVWLQYVSEASPLRHVIIAVRSIFLKDASMLYLMHEINAFMIISIITFGVSLIVFKFKITQ